MNRLRTSGPKFSLNGYADVARSDFRADRSRLMRPHFASAHFGSPVTDRFSFTETERSAHFKLSLTRTLITFAVGAALLSFLLVVAARPGKPMVVLGARQGESAKNIDRIRGGDALAVLRTGSGRGAARVAARSSLAHAVDRP
jgi:hypothetical protein